MALKTLRSTLRVLPMSTLRAPAPADTTPRLRGRAGVERRRRWLALHPLCVDCTAEGKLAGVADEVDHEVPLWKGGADDESNFASRCRTHHAAKTTREAAERARRGSLT